MKTTFILTCILLCHFTFELHAQSVVKWTNLENFSRSGSGLGSYTPSGINDPQMLLYYLLNNYGLSSYYASSAASSLDVFNARDTGNFSFIITRPRADHTLYGFAVNNFMYPGILGLDYPNGQDGVFPTLLFYVDVMDTYAVIYNQNNPIASISISTGDTITIYKVIDGFPGPPSPTSGSIKFYKGNNYTGDSITFCEYCGYSWGWNLNIGVVEEPVGGYYIGPIKSNFGTYHIENSTDVVDFGSSDYSVTWDTTTFIDALAQVDTLSPSIVETSPAFTSAGYGVSANKLLNTSDGYIQYMELLPPGSSGMQEFGLASFKDYTLDGNSNTFANNNGTLQIYENSVLIGNYGAVQIGDILQIIRYKGYFAWVKNGDFLYVSTSDGYNMFQSPYSPSPTGDDDFGMHAICYFTGAPGALFNVTSSFSAPLHAPVIGSSATTAYCSGGGTPFILYLTNPQDWANRPNDWAHYQWYKNDTAIAGSDSTLIHENTPPTVTTSYYAKVFNNYGDTLSSNTVTLGPTASVSGVNVKCKGGTDGSARVTVTGGTLPYAYSWSPRAGGSTTLADLSPGTYYVNITDAHGCALRDSVHITEPATAVTLSVTTVPSLCNEAVGSATAIASGGTPASAGYNYFWPDIGLRSSSISGVHAGVYHVIATDNNGCSSLADAGISDSNAPAATVSVTSNVSCNGGNNGILTITGGGTYTRPPEFGPCVEQIGYFGFVPGASSYSVRSGHYSITLTDSNGCIIALSADVTQPSPLTASIATSSSLCGQSIGKAVAVVNGGTRPYSYLWSSGSTDSLASGLSSGQYALAITDAKGCSSQAVTVVADSAVLSLSTSVTNASCFESNNGTAKVTASGGTGPYSYLWSVNGLTSDSISGLYAGSYTVKVTDVNGCLQKASVSISQPERLHVNVTETPPTADTLANGSAFAEVSGGTPGYSYLWSNGASAAAPAGLAAGSYTVTVADASQCAFQGHVFLPSQAFTGMSTCTGNSPYTYTPPCNDTCTCAPCSTCTNPVLNIRTDFGAIGNGVADDECAFEWANDFITQWYRHSGVTLYIPEGTYLVGRQDKFGVNGNFKYAYKGHHILCFDSCSNITVIGDQSNGVPTSIIQFKDCMKFGAFDTATGKRYLRSPCCQELGRENDSDYAYAAYPGNCFNLTYCDTITIKNLELNGNCDHLTIGGYWGLGHAGFQKLSAGGIYAVTCSNLMFQNLNVHHFGLDGLEYEHSNTGKAMNMFITNSKFNWNCRNGMTWGSGNTLVATDCEFNYNAFGNFGGSKEADGLDIEYTYPGSLPANGTFYNCSFKNNRANGVETNGTGSDFTFNNCRFVSSHYGNAAFPNGPNFTFNCSDFYGSLVAVYNAKLNTNENGKFLSCTFNEEYKDPDSSNPDYNVTYSHTQDTTAQADCETSTDPSKHFPHHWMVDLASASNALFDGCTFKTNHYNKWCHLQTDQGLAIVRNTSFYNYGLDGLCGSCGYGDNRELGWFVNVDVSQNNTCYTPTYSGCHYDKYLDCYWANDCSENGVNCAQHGLWGHLPIPRGTAGSFLRCDPGIHPYEDTTWTNVTGHTDTLPCSHKYKDPNEYSNYPPFPINIYPDTCPGSCFILLDAICPGYHGCDPPCEDRKSAATKSYLNGFNVYPVPVTQILYIENIEAGQSVILMDVVGKVLMDTKADSNRIQLDVSSLSSGVYFIEVKGNGIRKIIKF